MFSLSIPLDETSVDYFYDYSTENYWNTTDEPVYERECHSQQVFCPACTRQLSSRKTLYRHLRNIHRWPENQVQELIKKSAITIDEMKLKDRFYVANTFQKLPNIVKKSKSKAPTVPCPVPGCLENLGYHEALAHHCELYHSNVGAAGQQQDYRLKEVWHSSFEEFEKWLCTLERNTGSSFVKRTTSRNCDIMYRCHRTGNPPMNYKNESKRHGHQSRKVQSHFFCEGHILHELDLVKTWLNKSDKIYLKYLLELHSEFDKILDHIRRERTPDERVYWTTRNDLRNIRSSFAQKLRRTTYKSSCISNVKLLHHIHLDHNYCKKNLSIC
ncbi:unnamed protein product [Auanema sp. JU1783]|nr:unnamed protein product [Auanema sp. JU1783]